jgi:predicted nuclease of restriction endonuclease-like RecB superfamily
MSATGDANIVLTKDLIRCRLDRGRLKPRFVSTDDPELLALANNLLEPYRQTDAPRRCDIEEITEPFCKGAKELILARGLRKIIDDQAEFASGDDYDYPSARRRLFAHAASLLNGSERLSEEQYRQGLAELAGDEPLLAAGRLYADLPENDRLRRFQDLTARQLLERYNCGLVQALLLRASAMELNLDSSDASKLRRLFKYLKFFRLLCRVQGAVPAEEVNSADAPEAAAAAAPASFLAARIDGPASMLTENKRYGLQLACFFPAVCALRRWQLRAEVEWKGQKRELLLDESSGLVSHYHNFTAYVPDEIKLFQSHFADTVKHWSIVEHTPFLAGHGNDLIFPDLSFSHCAGLLMHLELFHRWHAGPLRERLDYLRQQPSLPLLLGVDRALCRQRSPLAEELASEPAFADRVFLFRDYPSVEKTLQCLDKALERKAKRKKRRPKA